ncbi:hypothetical protein Tco_0624741 [Tanacetum coccineum]|uniref:Uncharacterized protein n=1 Tax=Tanacetum coccineum TaxID=301880 RepID=A0ABQ4WEU3_9ASTR
MEATRSHTDYQSDCKTSYFNPADMILVNEIRIYFLMTGFTLMGKEKAGLERNEMKAKNNLVDGTATRTN